MIDLRTLFFVFAFGAFAGWVFEVIIRAIVGKKIVNPGFLKGPYLPIYGFATVFLFLISFLDTDLIFKLIVVALVPTVIELIGGLIFVRYYKLDLWTYTHHKYNYKGIISLQVSIVWAVLCIICYYVISKYATFIYGILQHNWAIILLCLFYLIFIIDFIYSVNKKIIQANVR